MPPMRTTRPTIRITPPKRMPSSLLENEVRVLRADGRSPALRFFGPRRGIRYCHHFFLTICASCSEVPHRLQNLRVASLPSPHSGQIRSPGLSRRVGGRLCTAGALGCAACGFSAVGCSPDSGVPTGSLGLATSADASGSSSGFGGGGAAGAAVAVGDTSEAASVFGGGGAAVGATATGPNCVGPSAARGGGGVADGSGGGPPPPRGGGGGGGGGGPRPPGGGGGGRGGGGGGPGGRHATPGGRKEER